MNRLTIFGVLALTVCAIPALGQDDAKERVRREVDRKQQLMREGKVIRTNVRVTVRLNNGSRLRGVVKQGRLIERHDGLEFVPSDLSAEGAGMRLWYYDSTNSYIFLPFGQIREHAIGERLTDEEVRQLGLELDRKAKEAKEKAARKAEGSTPGDPAAPTGPVPLTPGEPGAVPVADAGKPAPVRVAEPPKSKLTAEQKAILAEFPPEAGWGPGKKREIQMRSVQVHVYPNDQEQKFLDNFELWSMAEEIRRAETPAPTEGKPAVVPTPNAKPAPAPSPAPPGGSTPPQD